MTALRKDDGGVRGIVARDVVRRLVSRTIVRQLGEAVKVATAPFQYALSIRAGCQCVAHVLKAVTEADPQCDRAEGGELALLVRMLYGQPSIYLWEGEGGTVHDIHEGEGGEQGKTH